MSINRRLIIFSLIMLKSIVFFGQDSFYLSKIIDSNYIRNNQEYSELFTKNLLNTVYEYYVQPDSNKYNLGVYSQAFSMLGRQNFTNHQSPVNVFKEKEIFLNAANDVRDVIIKLATKYNVIFINEAHDNPLHRAFVLSLFSKLKAIGYNTLACEDFNENINQNNIIQSSMGYYINEPTFGELVRSAKQLDFKLLNYEPTDYSNATGYLSNWRDSMSAQNLYNSYKKNGKGKMIVFCGYGHISKRIEDYINPPIKMLAYNFKTLMGEDVLTIDQTTYDEPKSSNQKVSLIFKNKSEPIDYDYFVAHPKTNMINNRPDWIASFLKKHISSFAINDELYNDGLVLIQAFYKNEIDSIGINKAIPSDQFFIDKKYATVYLFLKENIEYTIVYRNYNSDILKQEHLMISKSH